MQKPMMYPQVYTVDELARLFTLSPEAVRNLIRKGEIAAIRIGKQYRARRTWLSVSSRRPFRLKIGAAECGSSTPLTV